MLVESLLKCKVEGNKVLLPTERLDNYADVRSALLKAGAKYKSNAFIFEAEAKPIMERLTGGEKVNFKKEFQFFETSEELADDMVFEAQIEPHHKILEPEAGRGAIIKAIYRVFPKAKVDYCEISEVNRSFMNFTGSHKFVCADFLEMRNSGNKKKYDRIIANPPFTKNQDIDHVYEMYHHLAKGGRIVTIMSAHWKDSDKKKETEFKKWLKDLKADVRDNEAGAFKESGTNVATVMVIINKK